MNKLVFLIAVLLASPALADGFDYQDGSQAQPYSGFDYQAPPDWTPPPLPNAAGPLYNDDN